MITEALNNLYQSYTGNLAETIEELPFSSSNRRYFRLSGVKNLIGVSGTSIEENKAFIYMAEHFRKKRSSGSRSLLCLRRPFFLPTGRPGRYATF